MNILKEIETDKAAILVHGLGGNKNNWLFRRLEETLNITTLRIDMYGHGDDKGKIENLTIEKCVQSVTDAIDTLSKRYPKIALLGFSLGGLACTIAATKRNIKALTLICPATDIKEIEETEQGLEGMKKWKREGITNVQGMPIKYEFYDTATTGYQVAPKIKAKTLIIHGDSDTVVPIEQSKKLNKLIKGSKLHTIKGADHDFSEQEEYEEVIEESTKFILNSL